MLNSLLFSVGGIKREVLKAMQLFLYHRKQKTNDKVVHK